MPVVTEVAYQNPRIQKNGKQRGTTVVVKEIRCLFPDIIKFHIPR